jgi:hypothetical protein
LIVDEAARTLTFARGAFRFIAVDVRPMVSVSLFSHAWGIDLSMHASEAEGRFILMPVAAYRMRSRSPLTASSRASTERS